MQRYFTIQIFECFNIPIDDLWAVFDVLDGVRMRRRMHSIFCRHSILRLTHTLQTEAVAHSSGHCIRQSNILIGGAL